MPTQRSSSDVAVRVTEERHAHVTEEDYECCSWLSVHYRRGRGERQVQHAMEVGGVLLCRNILMLLFSAWWPAPGLGTMARHKPAPALAAV